MKLSDYIVHYLVEKGVDKVFGYPGGMVTHLMDSLSKSRDITSCLCYHEQGCGFAACSWAQISGKVGVAYATSGPGATNLLTPLCHAFFESIPVLFITGQVNTHESKGRLPVRQKGFQELDVVGMVGHITKYSAYVDDPETIRFHLDSAFYHASSGRPGPVLLDIPMNILNAEIDTDTLAHPYAGEHATDIDNAVEIISQALAASKRPVIIAGNGINASGTRGYFQDLVKKWGIPVVTSMIAVDLLHSDADEMFGFIGTYGHRWANFIVSQCDLIISMGSRMDVRQTGSNLDAFAKDARLVRIDIDAGELQDKKKKDEIQIFADLRVLLPALCMKPPISGSDYAPWKARCRFYKRELSGLDHSMPTDIVRAIGAVAPANTIFTTDVGQNQVWVAQALPVNGNQRVLFSGGLGAMGVSLPSAVGASIASNSPVFCFCGDGGFSMNIQELQTVARDGIPIKIFLMDNQSLGMIRHFQEQYFASNYAYTVKGGGYLSPDFARIGSAYGIQSYTIRSTGDVKALSDIIVDDTPALFVCDVGDKTYLTPKLEYTKPLYDQSPPLDEEMLIRLARHGQ